MYAIALKDDDDDASFLNVMWRNKTLMIQFSFFFFTRVRHHPCCLPPPNLFGIVDSLAGRQYEFVEDESCGSHDFLQHDVSLLEWDSSCARQHACSSTFIVSESLFPIRSHGEYYLKVPLRVLVESTSRVSSTHTPRWHPNLSRLKANLNRLREVDRRRQVCQWEGCVCVCEAIVSPLMLRLITYGCVVGEDVCLLQWIKRDLGGIYK